MSDERYVTPHTRHRHIYVVCRVDLPVGEADPFQSFTLTKAFGSEADAIREVGRLNRLNATKSCRYEYRVARLVEGG